MDSDLVLQGEMDMLLRELFILCAQLMARETITQQQPESLNSHESREDLLPSRETLSQLENLEKDTYAKNHKDQIHDELLSQIDASDGIDEREQQYMYIIEDFFDNFLDERGIDDVSDDTKDMLRQRIQTHGYTIANLDSLAKNLRSQATRIEGQSPQEKKAAIHRILASAMGGYVLDQIDTAAGELPIHDQFAILAELQLITEQLTEEQKERKRKMREKLLAELFEWKNLEIYEVVIDASGRVMITMKDPHGETVTIAYNPSDGTLSRIDAGSVDDIIPADQTKIAQVIEQVREQQSLPYDPEDTGTLLQFVADAL